MKGTLHKTENGWGVWYTKPRTDNQNGYYLESLPLHPFDVLTAELIYPESLNLDIEFDIVDSEPTFIKGVYAKMKPYDRNIT